MKVVHELNKKGYVDTIRGKNGGLRLGLQPADIRIGVLIQDMERDMSLVECFSSENDCVITPVCGLKAILIEGLEAFFTALDQYTLEDILPDQYKPQLVQLLNLNDVLNR